MRCINPNLFARLMWLPDSVRVDLLEYVGSTPVADAHLERMIEFLSASLEPGRVLSGADPI